MSFEPIETEVEPEMTKPPITRCLVFFCKDRRKLSFPLLVTFLKLHRRRRRRRRCRRSSLRGLEPVL